MASKEQKLSSQEHDLAGVGVWTNGKQHKALPKEISEQDIQSTGQGRHNELKRAGHHSASGQSREQQNRAASGGGRDALVDYDYSMRRWIAERDEP